MNQILDTQTLTLYKYQAKSEPVYLYRRKGLGEFTECSRERYNELSTKPYHFQTKVLYTAPQIPEGYTLVPIKLEGDIWKDALDHELASFNLTTGDFSSPKEALKALIEWHVLLATDSNVNGGYALVPIEPTPEMLKSGWAENDVPLAARWKAMLEAAPELKK